MKRYLTYLALIAATALLIPGPAVAQVHFGLPSAVKSAVKKLKSKKNAATVSSIVLGPLTKVLTTDTDSKFLSVSAGSTTYHYDIGATQFAALSAGDIMLSSQGDGLLRKIVSITPTPTEYAILTTTATLEEAFEKLDVTFSQTFTPSAVSPQYLKGFKPQSVPLGQFELSTSVVLSPNITADATLTFAPAIDGKIKIEGFQLKEFAFTSIFDGSLELTLTATVAETLTKEVRVAEFPLGVVMVGPVPIVSNYLIDVGLEANLQAEAATSVTQEVSFEAGVSYLNGVWTPHTTLDNSFTFTPPTLSAEGSLKAYIAPEINAKILNVAGPYVDAEGYLKGIVTTPLNHLPWEVKGGIGINAGVKVEVLSWALAEWSAALYNAEIQLSSGVLLNQAPGISAVTPNPSDISAGATTTITCSASDSDGDSLTYAWSAASGTLSSASGNPVTWTAPLVASTYTITCGVTDGWGGSAQKSTNVVVFADSPSNNAPVLSWTGESNYTTDGINPETGVSTTPFIYRIKYADADNDAPTSGYPKVHVLKAGEEISGSPFGMTAVDSNAYTTGRKYTYSKTLLGGGDYTYYFEARDIYGAIATGAPTSSKDSPDVDYVYTWSNSIADSENGVPLVPTAPSLAIDSTGYPQIVYDGWRMRHVTATQIPPNDATWFKTPLSNSGLFQSATIGTDNSLHIAYRDADACCGPNYINKPSGQLPSTPIPTGGGTSMDSNISIALDSSNNPYISYTYTWVEDSYGNGVIHCAWRNGSSWIYLTDVGAGNYSSVSVGPNGYPHIAYLYTDANGTYLRYAKWNGSSWAAASQFDYGSPPSIKVDSNNYPHIAYGNKYVEWDGFSWTTPPQTTPSNVWPSLVLDSNANPHIAYTASGNVYYTKRSSPSSSWDTPQTALMGTGLFDIPPLSYNRASLVLENGKPRIAASDSLSGYLVYIWGQ